MKPEELKSKREALGLNQEELAQKLGKTRITINRWENSNSIPDSAQKVLNMFFKDVSKQEKNVTKKQHNDTKVSPNKEPDAMWVDFNSFMMVPLVHHRAQAGFLNSWGDEEYVDELPKVPFEVDREYKGKYLCFEVNGDSMLDENNIDSLFERDILLCREVQRIHWQSRLHIHNWKYFVVVHREKGILVKEIIKHDTETGSLTLHSLNPYYDDQIVLMDDLLAIYNVVDIKRSARR